MAEVGRLDERSDGRVGCLGHGCKELYGTARTAARSCWPRLSAIVSFASLMYPGTARIYNPNGMPSGGIVQVQGFVQRYRQLDRYKLR